MQISKLIDMYIQRLCQKVEEPYFLQKGLQQTTRNHSYRELDGTLKSIKGDSIIRMPRFNQKIVVLSVNRDTLIISRK